MKRYNAVRMIRPEHLNHHGSLYAGRAADWMMDASFVAACRELGNTDGLMYRNTHEFSFTSPIVNGDVIRVEACVVRFGKKSITIHIGFINEFTGALHAEGYTTFVTIDAESHKSAPHGLSLDEGDEEEAAWRSRAECFFNNIKE